tara:strand:- start:1515 stop:4991 length:3477 start_codon:yes stop_codon:yes gene_type:complete
MTENDDRLIDNSRIKLKTVLEKYCKQYNDLSIATGYWDLKSITELEASLDSLKKIRLLIGKEPLIPRYGVNDIEDDFPEDDISNDLIELDQSSEHKIIISKIKQWIDEEKLEVKILKNRFLHAKSYIFGTLESPKAIGIIGSSNFTGNGLSNNSELNYVENTSQIVQFEPRSPEQGHGHLSWFNELWNSDYCEDWDISFQEILSYSPVGDKLFSPHESYIKTVYELYKENILEISNFDIENEISERPLFHFQKENTELLINKLNKHGVAMLCDSVGLGKTITAIAVIKKLKKSLKPNLRVEVLCPASLKEYWIRELKKEKIFNVEVTSKSNIKEINSKKDEKIDLFIIDEAHNLKNLNSKSSESIATWIQDCNPKVLLLTATPIANRLKDIESQLLLGTGGNTNNFYLNYFDEKGSETLDWSSYIKRVESWLQKQRRENNGIIDKDALNAKMNPVIREFVVRRTRQGVINRYGTLRTDSSKMSFPNVIPENLEYSFDKKVDFSLYNLDEINILDYIQKDPSSLEEKLKNNLLHPIDVYQHYEKDIETIENENNQMLFVFYLILLLGLAPYKWSMYDKRIYGKKRKDVYSSIEDEEELQRINMQLNFYGIFRSIFLKRMESSVHSFEISIKRYSKLLSIFKKGIDVNKFIKSKSLEELKKIFHEDPEGLDQDSEKIFTNIENLDSDFFEEIDKKNYRIDELKKDIDRDQKIVEIILKIAEMMKNDEPKIKELNDVLYKIKKEKPDSKVLIFTYFKDTLAYLKENLLNDENSLISINNAEFISSEISNEREGILDRFAPKARGIEESISDDLTYLFTTDTLSEGQNLQDAQYLINYDLHWSPVRMIQRNGRINRLGSDYDEVFVINYRPDESLDRFLKLVRRLEEKIEVIQYTIGNDAPILDEKENPLDFIDKIEDLYSNNPEIRKKALENIEEELDYITPDEKFIDDLIKFDTEEDEEYKQKIYGINMGKWNHHVKDLSSGSMSLIKTFNTTDKDYFNFRIFNFKDDKLIEQPLTQFITNLRSGNYDNKDRKDDQITIDKVKVNDLINKRMRSEGKQITDTRKFTPKDLKFIDKIEKLVLEDSFRNLIEALGTNNVIDLKKLLKKRDRILKMIDNGDNSEDIFNELGEMEIFYLTRKENYKENQIMNDYSILLHFANNE